MFHTAYQNSSIDWKPSPIVALITSANNSQVAAARQDGSLEVWLVSPGSVGWHCQLTIQGDPNARVSSLVWLPPTSNNSSGKLLSSGIDGSVSEWDLFNLKQKKLLESSGITIWQMALAPSSNQLSNGEIHRDRSGEDSDSSDSESDSENEGTTTSVNTQLLAIACDDGCVRLYNTLESDELVYVKSLPRVSGRMLSVTWTSDGTSIFAGTSDGLIRCWNAHSTQELYRITAGNGACIWSLLFLRCGTLVSGDSTGYVQFWNSDHGTLLQSLSCHAGDVNALAAAPSHHRVFSAGADGQVVLYKLSNEGGETGSATQSIKKWVSVNQVRAHTHDIKALTIAVPIISNDRSMDENIKQQRCMKMAGESSYNKWANVGVPMVISGGDDTKLFAYSATEFTKFSPHDICPAPQRVPMQLVMSPDSFQLLLVQSTFSVDIFNVRVKKQGLSDWAPGPSMGHASTDLIARVKTKNSRKIISSCISSSGNYFAYSDSSKVSLFELKKREFEKSWAVKKLRVFHNLPSAHCMVFTAYSSSLILAAHDRKIHIVDVAEGELSHTFNPSRDKVDGRDSSDEPPITKMFASHDSQWLAASNCFGDLYIFNLETLRQHWFVARMDGAAVTAGGFAPENGNVLVVTTSSNMVYALDVEAKQLGDWSMRHTYSVPQRFHNFPGEVIGLSFVGPSRMIVYSARAMCMIDFGMGVEKDDVAGYHSPVAMMANGGLKRKFDGGRDRRNFDIVGLRDPVLFIGNLWDSLLIVDKPWMLVLGNLDSAPLHRHVYGS